MQAYTGCGFPSGTVMMDRWCLDSHLGTGMYGCVAKAHDIKTGKHVAIKFSKYMECDIEVKFQTIAAATGISPYVHGLYRSPKGRDMIVMELVKGIHPRTLNNAQRVSVGGALLDVAEQLDKLGIWHGDFHAGNLMYDEVQNRAYIIDYGVARYMDTKHGPNRLLVKTMYSIDDKDPRVRAAAATHYRRRWASMGYSVADMKAEVAHKEQLLHERLLMIMQW